MSEPVGYFIHDKSEQRGGYLFNYHWGKDGVYIDTDNPVLHARIPIARFETRGLSEIETEVNLIHGKIPAQLFEEVLYEMLRTPTIETYYAVIFEDGAYRIRKTAQEGREDTVDYETINGTVLEFHSHGEMIPFFSFTDDKDEQGLKLYGVVGCLTSPLPLTYLRIGVYGYFKQLAWGDVLEGKPEHLETPPEELN